MSLHESEFSPALFDRSNWLRTDAPSHVAHRDAETVARALQILLGALASGGVTAALQVLKGTCLGLACTLYVNPLSGLSRFGQDSHRVIEHLKETAARGKDDTLAAIGRDEERADVECREHGRVVGKHLEGAFHAGRADAFGLSLKDVPVRCYDFYV